jgi:hypothetical protein
MPYARKLASDMIERGFKSVEIVQAYMLLAYYNTPTERFEDDRTWTYIGLAIRMAVELNLWRNPKQPPDLDEEGLASFAMETANRERTWYQIFIMDVGNHSGMTCGHGDLIIGWFVPITAFHCHTNRSSTFPKSRPLRAQCKSLVTAAWSSIARCWDGSQWVPHWMRPILH